MKWTDDKVAELKRLYEMDTPREVICDHFGITEYAMKSAAERYGIRRPNGPVLSEQITWTPEMVDTVRQMKLEGSTNSDIAAALDSTVLAIKAVVRKHNLSVKPYTANPNREPIGRVRESSLIAPLYVGLLELEAGMCRWPYGEGPYRFCGLEAQAGGSYCRHHRRMAYLPKEQREQRSAA